MLVDSCRVWGFGESADGSGAPTTELVEGVDAATGPELVTDGLEHGGVEHATTLEV
jgi:hypothetical protein